MEKRRMYSGQTEEVINPIHPAIRFGSPLLHHPIANRRSKRARWHSRRSALLYHYTNESICAHPFECSCKADIIFPLTVPRVLPVFQRIKSGITRPRRTVHRSNECTPPDITQILYKIITLSQNIILFKCNNNFRYSKKSLLLTIASLLP